MGLLIVVAMILDFGLTRVDSQVTQVGYRLSYCSQGNQVPLTRSAADLLVHGRLQRPRDLKANHVGFRA